MNIHAVWRVAAAFAVVLAFVLLMPTGASAVGAGKRCGGIAGISCDAGLFCQHPAGRCNVADATGTCARAPQVCTAIYQPVCGCDGKTYGNDCERQAARVSKAHNGKCKAPKG